MAFLWVQSPHLSLQLAHSTAKEHTWLEERLARAKDREKIKKKEVGVGAPSTKLKYAFVM